MIPAAQIRALRESFVAIAQHDSLERGEAALILELLDALEAARQERDQLATVARGVLASVPGVDGQADASLVLVQVRCLRALQAAVAPGERGGWSVMEHDGTRMPGR